MIKTLHPGEIQNFITMPHLSRTFPAKLILFGEYTTLLGGDSLAIPYKRWKGQWVFEREEYPFMEDLVRLGKHTANQKDIAFDIDSYFRDLEKGLSFKSDIPVGSGCGSSGAVS